MQDYSNPDYVHFFSHETKVSLELPIEWEEEEENEGMATYAYGVDEDEEPEYEYPPRLMVKTIGIPSGQPDAYRKLAQQMIDMPARDKKIVSRDTQEIDGHEGTVDVFSYYLDDAGGLVTQYQVFVQISNVIFSITGMVEDKHGEELLPVFGAAAKSIRFILM